MWLRRSVAKDERTPLLGRADIVDEHTASYISRALWLWIIPLLRADHTEELQQDDVPAIGADDATERVARRLERALHERHGSLARALFDVFRWRSLSSVVLIAVGEMCVTTTALLLRYVIACASESYAGDASAVGRGLVLVLLMLLLNVLASVLLSRAQYLAVQVGVLARSACVSLIHQKALRISPRDKCEKGLDDGAILVLANRDAERFYTTALGNHQCVGQVISLLYTYALLVHLLGYSALAGFAILAVIKPVQIPLASRTVYRFRRVAIEYTKQRSVLMLAILRGIRYIKVFAWERSFAADVGALRWRETWKIRGVHFANMGNWAFEQLQTGLVILTMLVTYNLTGHAFTADIVFSSLALFTLSKEPIGAIIMTLAYLDSVILSLRGIEELLQTADRTEPPHVQGETTILEQATFIWESTTEEDAFQVRDIDLRLGPGLNAVVGRVASGKSSLLSAVAGEMRLVQGSMVATEGPMAVCSQTPWIRNGTVRDNILFGSDMDESWYDTVIRACALDRDFEILPAGDQTAIGEFGINLSGGQKSRISLARGIYRKPKLLIADDPLSAVDAQVGRHIFEQAFKRLLKDTCVLLATHQLQFLEDCHGVIWMENGDIMFKGTYDQALHDEDFSRFLGAHHYKGAAEIGGPDIRESAAIKGALLQQSQKLIEDEDRQVRKVEWRVIKAFIRAMGPPFTVPLICVWAVFSQGSVMATSVWLAAWVGNVFPMLSDQQYITVFIAATLFSTVLPYGYACLLQISCTRASNKITEDALHSVLRAPTSFFDSQPIGRILSRFNKDVTLLDEEGTILLKVVLQETTGLLAVFVLTVAAYPVFAFPLVLFYSLSVYLVLYTQSTTRELRRLASLQASKVSSALQEGLSGATSLRIYKQEAAARKALNENLDSCNTSMFHEAATQAALLAWLNYINIMLLAIAGVLVMVRSSQILPSIGGVVLANCMKIMTMTRLAAFGYAGVERMLHALERIHYYSTSIPQEAPIHTDVKPHANWPAHGGITFEHVAMRYNPVLPMVLHDFNLHIKPGERVGIVGRTGAGKSSLINAIFRICELSKGRILIDGVDIADIGLEDLRSNISIIPQDPLLFSGTIRKNLDPFGHHTDAELVHVLEQVSQAAAPDATDAPVTTGTTAPHPVSTFSLSAHVDNDGSNFSLGERQQLSLARSLLGRSRVVLLDEATSAVDLRLDAAIQARLARRLRSRTVVSIAHRLRTVLAFDRVVVLRAGRIVEQGAPLALWRREDGAAAFRDLCDRSYIVESDILAAREAMLDGCRGDEEGEDEEEGEMHR